MTESTVVLIVAFFGLVGVVAVPASAILVVWITGRQAAKAKMAEAAIRKEEREADYARQDEVADRVEAAAKQAGEAAGLLVASNAEVAEAAKEAAGVVGGKLDGLKEVADQTHLLVNSNMMKEMRKGLVSDKGQLLQLQRVIALSAKLGMKVNEEDKAYLAVLEQEIDNAEKSLKELEKRTAAAAKVIDASPA